MAPTPPVAAPSGVKKRGQRGSYKTLTMAKKAEIIRQVEGGRPQSEVAREFSISKQTVSDYLKQKAKILQAAEKASAGTQKNFRDGSHPQLEEALNMWLSATVARKIPVSGDLLRQKAETLALRMGITGCKFSDGWLRNFKKRYDLAFKRMCGESGSVDQTLVTNYRADKLCALLRQYPPENVFNCDETGLFYKMLPDKTLALSGEPCHGGKHSKERLTVVVGGNMTGTEKLPLLVIGKSKNPRCFKGVKSLPVWYEANSKAWITQNLFEQYLRKLDRRYEQQNRKVLMFVDNCGAHGHIDNLKAITVEFLPPNTTSVLQPMDQGVIKNLKVHYRSRLLNRMLLCVDSNKNYVVDVLTAISMLSDAWKSVTHETIHNCFRQAGFMTGIEEDSATGQDPAVESPPTAAADILDDLRASGVDVGAGTFEEFANFDSAVLPCAELDDDEIVRQVCEPALADSDSDDDAPPAPQPSNADLAQAISMLLSVYSDGQTLAEVQADVVARKRACVQTRIDSFFR